MKNLKASPRLGYDDDDYLETVRDEGKIYTLPAPRTFCFYLTGEIGPVNNYLNWIHVMKTAQEEDLFVFYINSPGGYLDTALQVTNAMRKCAGEIAVVVEGMCASAATLFLMSADSIEILPHSTFMFHTYTSGLFGKSNELEASMEYKKSWSRKIYSDYYTGFLSDEEIEAISEGKDFWFDAEETATRLNKRTIYKMEKAGIEVPEELKNFEKALEADENILIGTSESAEDKVKKGGRKPKVEDKNESKSTTEKVGDNNLSKEEILDILNELKVVVENLN